MRWGIKPYSTKTEDAFLENLNHALDNAFLDGSPLHGPQGEGTHRPGV
ncbi:hypothetical protein [Gemmiger formicilis]